MIHLAVSALILQALLPLTTALSGTVAPFPIGSCANALLTGATQCPSGKGCCVGPVCCAGGCCSLTSVCVAAGTVNEACCPLSDTTLCGTVAATTPSTGSSGSGSGSGLRLPVYCYANGDFTCPPGAICGATHGSCIGGSWAAPASGGGTGSGSGSGVSSANNLPSPVASSVKNSPSASVVSSVGSNGGGSGSGSPSSSVTKPSSSSGSVASSVPAQSGVSADQSVRSVGLLGLAVVLGLAMFLRA